MGRFEVDEYWLNDSLALVGNSYETLVVRFRLGLVWFIRLETEPNRTKPFIEKQKANQTVYELPSHLKPNHLNETV